MKWEVLILKETITLLMIAQTALILFGTTLVLGISRSFIFCGGRTSSCDGITNDSIRR